MTQLDIAALRRTIAQQENVHAEFRTRELLNFVFMKWLISQKGKYDESVFESDYPPAADYPVLPPSREFKPGPVTPTSHS